MKHFLRIAAFLVAFAGASVAQAAGCFWVGGTATWDGTNTGGGGAGGIKWASATGGGTTCAGGGTGGSPTTADTVTFDSASGGGTVTVNTTVSVQQIIMSTFTGTLDFATNNNNVTIASNFTNTGAGTRTLNMGSGTWTLTGNSCLFDQSGATNLTFNANTSTIAFTGTGGTTSRRMSLGTSRTYNIITFASGTAPVQIGGSSGNVIGTLTISPGNTVLMPNSTTTTITTFTNIAGSSSNQTVFITDNVTFGRSTISSANNWTCDWCGFSGMVFTGGGTFAGTNSFDFKDNSGVTITAPSGGGGGGGGGHIIGG